MWTSSQTGTFCFLAIITKTLIFSSLAVAQFNLDPCISKCIDQSTDDSCALSDLKCICRESNGRFLPDLVSCMRGACDPSLDVNALLTPLALGCKMLGTPLSESAIQNAQNVASSLSVAAARTATVTVALPSLTTVTRTTTIGGSTIVIAYSGTVGSNSVSLGSVVSTVTTTEPSTAHTATATVANTAATSFTGVVPVVIVGTNNAGSIFTTTKTVPGVISTITTTDVVGKTQTFVSTFIQDGTGTSTSSLTTVSQVVMSSSASAASGSTAVGPEAKSTAPNPEPSSSTTPAPNGRPTQGNSDGSPFSPQGNEAGKTDGIWVGVSVLLMGFLGFL